MQIIEEPKQLRAALDDERRAGRTIGFVPTMGYLHDGHASLIAAARETCDVVVVSIFVNPLQFGANEDLDRYPRDETRDERLCAEGGVDLVFRPSVEVMYGSGDGFTVAVGRIGTVLEGASRPGHFDGVATVVTKLFNIVGPCTAFFGEKDAQQLVVIRRLVESFDVPVEVVGCPTIREPDGLAMSSRNAYLDPSDRIAAGVLSKALFEARDAVASGARDANAIVRQVRERIAAEPRAEIDYVAAVDPRSLEPVEVVEGPVLVVLAVRFGSTRLIDNLLLAPGVS